jgi:hypothetical protein
MRSRVGTVLSGQDRSVVELAEPIAGQELVGKAFGGFPPASPCSALGLRFQKNGFVAPQAIASNDDTDVWQRETQAAQGRRLTHQARRAEFL